MEDGKIIFRVTMPSGVVESRVFANIKAFQDEIHEEETRWQGFPEFGGNDGNPQWNPIVTLNSFWGQIKTSSVSAITIIESIDAYYSNAQNWNTCYFPSWTTMGRVLLDHKTDREFLDGFSSGFFAQRNRPFSNYTHPQIGGIASAYALRAGFSTSSSGNIVKEMQVIREQHAQLMKEAIESKSQMEELYNKKLHLEAAVTYWGKKAEEHEKKKRLWMWNVVLWSVFSLGFLGAYLKWGGMFYTETIKIFVDEQWSFVCGFLILASFVYWVIRFVVSQYNQHNHLATDARERETMAETFLALVNDEKAKGSVTEENHLGLVLAALFRPSAIGGCDNGPVPFYEVVAKTLRKE